MSVSSIASSSAHSAALQTLKQSEANEVGPDHDGDADDAGVKPSITTPPAPAATVNTLGQLIGTTISTKA